MIYRHFLIVAISLFLGMATFVGGKPLAGTAAPCLAEKTVGVHPVTQDREKQQRRKGQQPRAQVFSNDLEGLRAQFNRDKGRVRLLMLLSPT